MKLLSATNNFIEGERMSSVSFKTASLDSFVSFGVSHLLVLLHWGVALSQVHTIIMRFFFVIGVAGFPRGFLLLWASRVRGLHLAYFLYISFLLILLAPVYKLSARAAPANLNGFYVECKLNE
ncbi:MAG: hypothetical protein K0U59_07905 [Gammaproteobacteria bacterium]|nr:hypothetical protein [Gammaproteobacteria bacterium]